MIKLGNRIVAEQETETLQILLFFKIIFKFIKTKKSDCIINFIF